MKRSLRLWPFSNTNPDLKQVRALNNEVNQHEPKISMLTNIDLQKQTDAYREKLAAGAELDSILTEAFAVAREAARRSNLHLRPRDVQVQAAIALHWGRMVEMQNGEGKTLVATMPLYLHSLLGHGAHLITANDYLAKRDAQWMGPIYHFLGLSVGLVGHNVAFQYDPQLNSPTKEFQHLKPVTRQVAYQCDVTYGSFDEMIFDYLRDNMVWESSQCVQRQLFYGIVDEADVIMLDMAISPFQISGSTTTSNFELCIKLADLVRMAPQNHITVENGNINLSETAVSFFQDKLGIDDLYATENTELLAYLDAALRAQFLYRRDDNYIVAAEEIVVIDQVLRRPMPGRKFPDGVHEALEAKEGLSLHSSATQTYAKISTQNYLKTYPHLSGMTGSASASQEEIKNAYDLDVISIPTYLPAARIDHDDLFFKSRQSKMRAIMREIKQIHDQKRPVLVGTRTEDDSNLLSDMLVREGIEHVVLNGKYHAKESEIISQAGQIGQVTISTRMAGRGVDIVLGPGVKDLGGLHVIGAEHQESRRLDAQLRGRAGRQGDPGSSQFFISLDDPFMQRFGGESIKNLMDRFKMDDDIPLKHSLLNKSIEQAQTRSEGYDLDRRKQILEFDEVLEQQQRIIYNQRNRIVTESDLKPILLDMIYDEIRSLVVQYTQTAHQDEWDLSGLMIKLRGMIPLPAILTINDWRSLSSEDIYNQLIEFANQGYEAKSRELNDLMPQAERMTLLRAIDQNWVRHLSNLDDARASASLKALAQHDILAAYTKEANSLYEKLLVSISSQLAHDIFRVQAARQVLPADLAK